MTDNERAQELSGAELLLSPEMLAAMDHVQPHMTFDEARLLLRAALRACPLEELERFILARRTDEQAPRVIVLTDALVHIYGREWGEADRQGANVEGQRTRAGLRAVFTALGFGVLETDLEREQP
jgi:hypothetical protein